MFQIVLILFSFVYLTLAADPFSSVADSFKRAGLDDELDKLPRSKLQIQYNGKEVNLGNVFDPMSVRYQPTKLFWGSNLNTNYTLVMFNPDATDFQVRHWLIVNIKGDNINTGDQISDYLGAGPQKNTGYNRYVFLVYRQKNGISGRFRVASSRSLNGRLNFNVNRFAKRFDLNLIYGNFFYSKYDPFVEKFNQNLEV